MAGDPDSETGEEEDTRRVFLAMLWVGAVSVMPSLMMPASG